MLKIVDDEAKHIRRVLRLKLGSGITVFDGSGKEYEGTIVEAGTSWVVITGHHTLSSTKESPLSITLAQSLLKGEKMDSGVQKATELGVTEIVPFFSSRSVPLLEISKKVKRHHRWERIAIEASKQCGREVLPRVEPLREYSQIFQVASPESLRIILCEREGRRLKEILSESKEREEIFFVVGPEGGLSQEEVEYAKGRGFIPVILGDRVLRAETASLCLLGLLQYEWGDIG